MADLPRYSIDAQRNYYRDPLLMIDPAPDGDWVKWGDVSARLQQLEQEKATLARRLASAEQGCRLTEVEMPNGSICLAPCVIEGCQYDELEKSRAALAETRDALHQRSWQAIATCPQARSVSVLLYSPNDGIRIGWRIEDSMWENSEGGLLEPTHWMPLPEPPS